MQLTMHSNGGKPSVGEYQHLPNHKSSPSINKLSQIAGIQAGKLCAVWEAPLWQQGTEKPWVSRKESRMNVKDLYICMCGETQTQRRAGREARALSPALVLVLTFQLKILQKGTVQPQA